MYKLVLMIQILPHLNTITNFIRQTLARYSSMWTLVPTKKL